MQNTTHTNITPEVSRSMRNNMRAMIHNLVLEFMQEQKAYIVKLADFKKWCSKNYSSGNTLVTEAQKYYTEAGFTGKSDIGPWYGGPYGFWQYDRLDRWCSKLEGITLRKENNRILLDNWNRI